ncbi:MAG: GntR family transcriptional regulator [Pseudomonadota bacterium]
MPKDLLKRENLSDKLAGIIGRKIIRNELKSGEIIYETQIAKEWGVSRSPVRDALRMLEQKRLVERTDKGSYRVTEMSAAFILNFYETVNILFQYAFAKTAEKATEKDMRALKNALKKIERSPASQDIDLYMKGMLEFAHTILRASGNPIVEQMAMELMPNAERIQWISITCLPDNMDKIVSNIQSSYQSISNKNPQGAAKAFADFAATHIEFANQYFLHNQIETAPAKVVKSV